MAENTTNYQCPACTGPLRFDSASGKLCCDYCGSTYDVAQVEALYSEKQARADKAPKPPKRRFQRPRLGRNGDGRSQQPHLHFLRCRAGLRPRNSCHHLPLLRQPHRAGRTAFRQAQAGVHHPLPDGKKTAIENLKKYYKGKAFLPKAFKESNHIEEIQGVYVPFWLYDGRMEARGAYKAEISESHREGDYIVTTTRHFDVARVGDAALSGAGGRLQQDAGRPYGRHRALRLQRPQALLHGLPARLSGGPVRRDDKKCAARVLTRMKNSTAAALHDTLGGYTGVQTLSEQLDPRTLEPHYALLPVWMLHTRWKEQDFLFAMNGQTGKLIGDLPVDKGRVAAWFAGISIPLMILTALIMLL